MLCSAAPEKVSALNLKRLKADNKTYGQSQQKRDIRTDVSFFVGAALCSANWSPAGRVAARARESRKGFPSTPPILLRDIR